MKVSLLQNNIWQMQPRGRWQEISAPFRWFLRSAFPCQEAESLMQKNPAMPRETLGEFSKHNCMLFFNEPVFQAYFHAKTLSRAHRFRGYVTDSLGRALEWHSRGQRFDPAYLHQSKKIRTTSSQSEMGSDFALSLMISHSAGETASAKHTIDKGRCKTGCGGHPTSIVS